MEQSPRSCSSLQVLYTFSPSWLVVQKPPPAPIRQQKTSHHGELNNSRLFFVAVIQLKKIKTPLYIHMKIHNWSKASNQFLSWFFPMILPPLLSYRHLVQGDSGNRHLPHPHIVEIEAWGENDLNVSGGGFNGVGRSKLKCSICCNQRASNAFWARSYALNLLQGRFSLDER